MFTYHEGEVPGAGYAILPRPNGLHVPRYESVQDRVKKQHQDDIKHGEVVIDRDALVDATPLHSSSCVQCHPPVITMSTSCHYNVTLLSLQCQPPVITMSTSCHYNVTLLSLQCQPHVITMSHLSGLLCQYNYVSKLLFTGKRSGEHQSGVEIVVVQ